MTGGIIIMTDYSEDNGWTIEEYKSLRSEVVERIKMQKQLEVFSLTAAALVWGAASITDSPEMAVWIGICAGLMILASALLAAYESQAIFKIGAYIAAKFENNHQTGVCWDSVAHDKRISATNGWYCKLNRHSMYYFMLTCVNILFALGFSGIAHDGLAVDSKLIAQISILITISLSMLYPIFKNEEAYASKQKCISRWKEILTEFQNQNDGGKWGRSR